MIGRVRSYNPNRGYGFLHSPAYGGDVFFHCTALMGASLVSPGDLVTFDVQSTAKGWRATGVTLLHPPTLRAPKTVLAAMQAREAEHQRERQREIELGLPAEDEEGRRDRWRRE